MLPVTAVPSVVEEFTDFFRRIFSWHQFRRFKQYLSGLNTGSKPTMLSAAHPLHPVGLEEGGRLLVRHPAPSHHFPVGAQDSCIGVLFVDVESRYKGAHGMV